MKRIWVALLVFSMLGGAVSANAISFKRKKTKKKESVEKEKTAYDKLFSSNHLKAEGFITVHKVKEKVYFELPLSLLKRDMLLGSAVTEISDNRNAIIGSKPTEPIHFRFEKLNNKICLSAIQTDNVSGDNDNRLKTAIALSNMDAILQAFDISAYNNDSTAVVFDVTGFFVGDNKLMDPFDKYSANMSRGRKRSTSFQSSKSFVDGFKAFKDNISVRSCLSYTYSLTGGSGKDIKDEPLTAKVTRSILLLDSVPYRPRLMDSRIGIFPTIKKEYSATKQTMRAIYYANRWRLEPSDLKSYVEGKKVTPVKPIVFYLDDAFPAAWAKGARMGILRWNKAFEKIGFKNVIQILDFPKDDPNFDPDNLKYSCIRYVPARVMNAMGPSWVDPSTGEIINASVLVYHDVVKLLNQWRFVQTAQVDERARSKKMDEDMITESIAYILAHEVGHCLGFMHNMAASAAFPVDSLRSASFTQKYGTTPSIMDYARFNYVAQPGDKGVKLTPPDLGVYDYYLVEYAYKPIFKAKDEMEEIPYLEAMIDAKAGDPLYRYGRQQVSGRYDPSAVEEDLGDDAIKASDYGVKNLKYILAHMNEWITDEMDPDGSYREMTYENLAKQYDRYFRHVMLNIGGIYLTDLKAGTPGERVRAVEKSKQKAALKWVINELKNCDWLDNEEVTKNFGLRVGLAPIMRYYTGLELFNSYSNVIFSSHIAGKEGYSPKEYFDDLYSLVWESAIKKNHVPESDRMLQRLFLERAVYVAGKATKPLQKVGLTDENSVAAAYAPSVDEIITMGLDESGVVERYKDVLRELEMKEGSGVVARKMAQDEIGYGYGWQYRVNLRSIDNSKDLLFGQLLRVQSLLKARMGAVDTDTKAHFKAMLYLIEEALDARSK